MNATKQWGCFRQDEHNEKLLLFGDEWVTAQYIGLQSLLTAILLAYWSGVEYTVAYIKGSTVPNDQTLVDATQKTSHRLSRRAF